MNAREEFLSALFRVLEEKGVLYCVLRNYDNIYDDPATDLDLVVAPEAVRRLQESLAEAAAAANYRLVLRTRYVNYSDVYWHAEGVFIRVDYDTEVRWRVFPVLNAKPVLQ